MTQKKIEIIKIKERCYNDPFYFIKEILEYNQVVEFHRELIDFVNKNNNEKLILLSRGHFKTSVITIGYSIWQIIKNPDIRILINNKILKNSKKMLFEIKQHFEKNQIFRALFGNWQGEKWREDEIVVNKRKKIYKEATVTIGATDHELTSGHYDLIINDDLAGLSDMISEVARESTLRFYRSSKYLGDKGTQFLTIGTRWHVRDVYSEIIKQLSPDNKMIRKAIQDNGEILFKERFTKLDIEKLRNDDPIMFQAQMQNNPTAYGEQIYSIDKLKFFEYNTFKGNYYIGYVDPAFGKKERGNPCFFCFVIGCIEKDKLYIIEWITNKQSPEQNEMLISNKCEEYRLKRLAIESNAAQSEFTRNVKRILKANEIILGIEDINHNTNKARRIEGMHGTVLNNVLFRQDWNDVYNEAMLQLTLYPYHKFLDAPDALEGLTSMAFLNELQEFKFGNETIEGKRK